LELEVPTLMQLKRLEVIEESSTTSGYGSNPDAPSNWGVAQGLITVGVLMTLLAVGWLVYVMQGKPPAPKEQLSNEYVEQEVGGMNLLQTFHLWGVLRSDLQMKRPIDQQYMALMKAYEIRFWVATIFVLAGVCFTLITILFARRATSRAEAEPGELYDDDDQN
jgi:hypothetical protein